MNIPDWLQFKNSERIALWRWRWHLQSGSRFWVARDLRDLRTDDERAMWRRLENRLRHTPKSRRVVSLAQLRIQRARRERRTA